MDILKELNGETSDDAQAKADNILALLDLGVGLTDQSKFFKDVVRGRANFDDVYESVMSDAEDAIGAEEDIFDRDYPWDQSRPGLDHRGRRRRSETALPRRSPPRQILAAIKKRRGKKKPDALSHAIAMTACKGDELKAVHTYARTLTLQAHTFSITRCS